jgi:hypothetical protein
VGFVVDKVAMGQGFPRVLRFSPDALLGKMKKKTDHLFHLHHKGCTISLKAAVRP